MSPHLTALAHLDVFAQPAVTAEAAGKELTTWVDDISYSGPAPRRDILSNIRRAAMAKGLLLHKIRRGGGKRRIELTGTSLTNAKADVNDASHL